jgi:hypothetical protein
MRSLLVAILLLALTCSPAAAGTLVWLMYGAGGQSTSTGVDEIAAKARQIPGVTAVNVREFRETDRIVDEIVATPATERIVVGGYSCGLNAATRVARKLWELGRKIATVVGIQQSKWCGGDDLESNVSYGQSTFAEDCAITHGLGCKPLAPAPSFTGQIINIDRPLPHGEADNDPQYQADVLKAIAATAWYGTDRPPPPDQPPATPRLDCRWAITEARGFAVLCSPQGL